MIAEEKMTQAEKTNPANRLTVPVSTGTIICLLLTLAILAAVPPVSRDALTHHLAVPKLFIQQGGIVEIPEVVFSYYPMNLDLLYMVPLYFGNDILPKYIHMAFGLLTAWLIYAYLFDRTGRRIYGLLGIIFFLSLPVIVKLSITVYVDLGLIFFSLAALLSMFKWARSGFRVRYLLISAVCCGLCLGTKYNGLISFFLLTCFVPVLSMRRNADATTRALGDDRSQSGTSETGRTIRALGYGVLFLSISLMVYSPWMLRNYHWKGNPIYPLHHSLFQSLGWAAPPAKVEKKPVSIAEDQKKSETLNHFGIRRLVYGESFLETFSVPLRVFFQGQDDNPRLFDGRLNPYLILLPVFAFWGISRGRRIRKIESALMAAFSVSYLLYAFFMIDMRIRYISPIIPPLVILSVLGIRELISRAGKPRKRAHRIFGIGLVIGVTGVLLGVNAVYIVKQFEVVRPFEYLSGRIDRDAYITRYRPSYPAMQYINAHLPDDSKILGVYIGNRIYHSDRKMISSNNLIDKVLAESDSVESLVAALQRQGVTHILIRHDFFTMYDLNHLTAEKRSLFERFQKSKMRTLYSDDLHGLYEIS
jgi:4-amino-4-deoxy-L-arabinose transferase-like glycosyltransferase